MPQLTDTQIRGAQPGTTLWDASLKGFGVRCLKSRKTFIVLIASGRRQSIGHYGPGGLTLSQARTEAKKLLASKTLGKVRPLHTAYEDARDEFLKARETELRLRTLADYKRLLTKHFPYGRTSLASITPRDILSRLNKLPQAERHHAFAAGRGFFRFCVSQHYLDHSPMADMQPPAASRPRERVLTDEELGTLCTLVFAPDSTFHRIIALCILTGQRRGELARLERSWLKDDVLTIPSHVTKNGRVHAFPIGQRAKGILDSTPKLSVAYFFPASRDRVKGKKATVFNGWGKPKAALDSQLGIAPWTIHDLRRTVSTGMAALGVPQIVVEKLLNHVSGGSQSQIAQVYNRHAYLGEMREAVEKWEAHLTSLSP